MTTTSPAAVRLQPVSQPARQDPELWLIVAVLTALYAVLLYYGNRRYVWFDELFTFDIARAPSLSQLISMNLRFDANPPLGYLLSRVSMKLFGPSPLGLRLPSMIEFYVGSAALFLYVRRLVGDAFAVLGVLLLWLSQTFRYATEARPYALMFMCFALLVVFWDAAGRGSRSRATLWGVAAANLGLLLAHVFGAFALLPILLAEVVRSLRRRKLDLALWAALLVPTLAMLSYIPLFMHYRSILFPPAFQASFHKLYEFGRNTGHPAGRALIKALCAVMAVIFTQAVLGRSPAQPRPALLLRLRPEDYALFAGTLLSPVLLTLILMHRHQAFWDRYAIASQAAIFAGVAIFLGARLSRNRAAAYAACLILLYSIYTHQIRPVQRSSTAGNAAVLDAVRPDLPLVVASDITFFEMNRYEDPTLLGRLYWLRDRAAAVRYAHATMFEDFLRPDLMRPYVPVPAHVETYPAFIQQHRQFLLLGTMGYAEDWLIPKLENDGAELSLVGKYEHLPYKDTTLYLVTMPATSGTPANL